MFDYTVMEVVRSIGAIAFGVWFYRTVIRPMRLYCRDREQFRKLVEGGCAKCAASSFFAFAIFSPLIMGKNKNQTLTGGNENDCYSDYCPDLYPASGRG